MVIILSAPRVLPPVAPNQWAGVSVTWFGADGSVWDLDAGTRGVFLLNAGTEGLHDPVISRFSSTSRVVPGNRLRGWRAEAREVFWPVLIYSNADATTWKSHYRAFFESIHPETPGRWVVGHNGEFRELQLTGVYSQGHAFDHDPLVMGWSKFGVELEAAQPYWSGTAQNFGPWYQPDVHDFFGETGAPDFYISRTAEIGRATVTNPGDVEAWMTWTCEGPLSDIEIGIGGTVATIPLTLDEGDTLTIDTDPRKQSGTLNGTDVTASLGLLRYGAIPPGRDVEIHVEAIGAGTISASLTPLYFRAM